MLPHDSIIPKTDRAILGMTTADIERFWSKVDKAPGQGPNGGCWTWTGARDSRGYGVLQIGRCTVKAHRIAWFIGTGAVPTGAFICHHCDNPPCCNLTDLFSGTPADNMADKCAKHRQAKGANVGPKNPAREDRNGARLYPERMTRGEQHHSAKLTRIAVAEIRALYADGYRDPRALAGRFGVNVSSIWKVVTRRTWKHVA